MLISRRKLSNETKKNGEKFTGLHNKFERTDHGADSKIDCNVQSLHFKGT